MTLSRMFKGALLAAALLSYGSLSAQNDASDKWARETLSRMTLTEKISMISGADWMHTSAVPRLGVPSLSMSDGPQGLGTNGASTAYPSTVLLAATWNEDMARSYGVSMGRDAKTRGIDILLGPAVNIYRSPMCGRNFEYMGEDPFLASRIATNYIKGVQSEGVLATVKHFFGNNSDYDRHVISNDIPERAMYEIYLPTFKAAIQEANVGALMTSYNKMDGVWTTENPALLKGILRDKWGFKGIVMSDWGSLHHGLPGALSGLDLEMPGPDGKMNMEDISYFVEAGFVPEKEIDEKVFHILRTIHAYSLGSHTPEGTIPLDDPRSAQVALDVAREGIVLLKNDRNFLPLSPRKIRSIVLVGPNAKGYVKGGGSGEVKPFHYVSLLDGITSRAAKAGIKVSYIDELDYMPDIVFTDKSLKTSGLASEYFPNMDLEGSPVHKGVETKVHYSWTGAPEYEGMPAEKYSARWSGVVCPSESGDYEFLFGGDDGYRFFIDGKLISDQWVNGAFRTETYRGHFDKGVPHEIVLEYFQDGGGAGVNLTWSKVGQGNEALVKILDRTDLIVACIGHDSFSEGEGRDRDWGLPDSDYKLLDMVSSSSTPVVAVVNAGGNVGVWNWQDKVESILWAGYSGQEAGTAVGEILFGDVNPSGHLPMTFERKWEDNPSFSSYLDPDGDKHVAYTEGIFIGYRGYDKAGTPVAYPFGHGLSYTTFSLSDMKVSKEKGNTVSVSLKVKNTGKKAGSAVVQIYVGPDGKSSVERPEKELKGFRKVALKPGKSTTVSLTLPASAFEYYDTAKGDFVLEALSYKVMAGFSSRDIKLEKSVSLK